MLEGNALMESSRPRVGLFVTCVVNSMRPNIGFAAIALLEAAGCTVEVPEQQTCCGQPAYNSGADDATRVITVRPSRLSKLTIISSRPPGPAPP